MGWLCPGKALAAVLAVYVLLCLAWNWTTPAWEGFDETSHVAYIEGVRHAGHLPTLPSSNLEAHQPPAYYLLQATLLRVTRLPDPPAPRAGPGVVGGPVYTHLGECHLCGGVLTLRLMRLVSTALGVATLLLVYQTLARVVASRWWAVSATATVAFIPEFGFVTAIVNNDALSYALGAATCLLAVMLAQCRGDRVVLRSLAVGASIGAALWTKEYAFALAPLAVLALLAATRDVRRLVAGAAAGAVSAVVVVSPLLWRNWRLYHELWPFHAERANITRLLPPYHMTVLKPWDAPLWTSMPKEMWISFWYSGGWGQLRFPPLVYLLLAGVVVPLLVLGVWHLWRHRRAFDWIDPAPATILMIAPALMYAGAWYSALHIQQWPGRYLFFALPGVAVWLVLGALTLPRYRRLALAALPAGTLALNLAALFLVALPAYR